MTRHLSLPMTKRPDAPYRKCALGVDLPSWFIHEVQGIESNLYPVWHEHRVLWEATITNRDRGALDDPRHVINSDYGCLNFGFVFTNGKGEPSKEHRWHLWRLNPENGWSHVYDLASRDGGYLRIVLQKLWFQDWVITNYGHRVFMKILREETEALCEEEKAMQLEFFKATQEENSWLMHAAADNFARGKTKPTNPTTGKIISYPGQVNRGTIVRPMQDEDAGIIIPGR